jgi:hypothetical protein
MINSSCANGYTMTTKCIQSPPKRPFLRVQLLNSAGRRRGHVELNIRFTTNIHSYNKRVGGPKSATVGRSSSFTPRRSTIAAASYIVLRTLMVLLLSRRPRRGDDEEVSNHRRSRGLLAAGGFVVLAYLRVLTHSQNRPTPRRIHNSNARSQRTYHHAQGIGMHLHEERIHAGALV